MQFFTWLNALLLGTHCLLPARLDRAGPCIGRWAGTALVGALLTACSETPDPATATHNCAPQAGLRVVCGIQAPEDLALLPDHSGILISEYGFMGDSAGRLSIYDLASGDIRTLYDLHSNIDLSLGQNLWGDDDCSEPDKFSPHGFDLSQRASGRWQLLVVNHGGGDSIEMFELAKNAKQRWALAWRGCVRADPSSLLNDVAATGSGFVTSQMLNADAWFHGGLDFIFGRKNGQLWRWELGSGLQRVDGVVGVGMNGVVSDNRAKRYYVNDYGGNTIKVFDAVKRQVVSEIELAKADNTNWDTTRAGFLLVASHRANTLQLARCMLNPLKNCRVPFSIVEIDTTTLEQREIFHSDGEYFGAGTAAVRLGEQLFIGSFAGDRLLIAPVGHGVQVL